MKKICRICGEPKIITEFREYTTRQGKLSRRGECRSCGSHLVMDYVRAHLDIRVYQNARHQDKRHGRICGITREDTRRLLALPCHYCTLPGGSIDRLDSSIGHIQANVVPCCLRCNCLKSDMPLEAWLILVPAVREAQLQNAFGSWIGHASRR